MSESSSTADLLDLHDRPGPECRELFGGSGNSPLSQDLSVLIRAERMSRPSANRKQSCSKFRVSHRIRDDSANGIIRSCAFWLRMLAAAGASSRCPASSVAAVRLDVAPELDHVGPEACVAPRAPGLRARDMHRR